MTDSHLRTFRFGQTEWQMGETPRLMGIVNFTPDSFSDGGQFSDAMDAVAHARELIDQGADVIDIGGESTRPNAEPVSAAEELRRVIPVVRQLSNDVRTPISIDTTKAEVAAEALAAGASIVNDISGLTFDKDMINVCADSDCGVIAMHIKGTPQTMQENPTYDNCLQEVQDFLAERVEAMTNAGIDRDRIMLDPGIGFGKTAEHNLELLQNIAALRSTGHPVLIGHSRKRFLKHVLGREVDERIYGTIGVAIALAAQHTDLIRVHDVQAIRDSLLAWKAIAD